LGEHAGREIIDSEVAAQVGDLGQCVVRLQVNMRERIGADEALCVYGSMPAIAIRGISRISQAV
jgi:hypothetical protein